MTENEIQELCEELKKCAEENKKDPKKARQFLINAGIFTKSGELAPYYKDLPYLLNCKNKYVDTENKLI